MRDWSAERWCSSNLLLGCSSCIGRDMATRENILDTESLALAGSLHGLVDLALLLTCTPPSPLPLDAPSSFLDPFWDHPFYFRWSFSLSSFFFLGRRFFVQNVDREESGHSLRPTSGIDARPTTGRSGVRPTSGRPKTGKSEKAMARRAKVRGSCTMVGMGWLGFGSLLSKERFLSASFCQLDRVHG